MTKAQYILHTKRWIRQFVIKLNLCPFAAEPFLANQIGYTVNLENHSVPIINSILEEAEKLTNSDHIETSFVILPEMKLSFESLYDFVNDIQELISGKKYEIKLIAFHPEFRYDGALPNDTSNATNRSPYPMVHLIKKTSLEKARNSAFDINEIPVKNEILLMGMTWSEIKSLSEK